MESDIEVQPGQILKVFSRDQTNRFVQEWMNIFCQNKQGANTKSYKWHIFSYEKYPAISGEKALTKYKEQLAAEYIVLSNENELAILTNKLPESCDLSDYYVFPNNFAWTMAFTHEDGWYGPYFAKHPEYDFLVQENLKGLKKQQEIEKAKENGWV